MSKKDNKIFSSYQYSVMRRGKLARQMGIKLKNNPYQYGSEIQEYCLWAAGWHDEK